MNKNQADVLRSVFSGSANLGTTRGEISILSWNINDGRSRIGGPKVEDADFSKLLAENDIFCLQETKSEIHLPDFICINSNRPDSRSGGVCIGYRKSLKNFISEYKTTASADIIGVSLKAAHFNLRDDIVLLNAYNSPEQSSYSIRKRKELNNEYTSTMDALESIVSDIRPKRSVILAGDLNARVADLIDVYIPSTHQGCNDHVWDSKDYTPIPRRSNKDNSANSSGKTLIDLLQTTDLVLLNGRTVGDIFGEITCYTWNGCSAIDIVCVSRPLYDTIKSMQVLDLNIFSDHRPTRTVISSRKGIMMQTLKANDFEDAPKPYSWSHGPASDENSSAFHYCAEQLKATPSAKADELSSRHLTSPDDVITFSNDLTGLLTSFAGPKPIRSRTKRTNKKKWFDWECRHSKRNLSKACKLYSKHPFDVAARNSFTSAKRAHKNLMSKKKDAYHHDLNAKIHSDRNINWDSFKKLKEEYKEKDPFDVYDLQGFYQFFQDLYDRRCSPTADSHANDEFSTRRRDDEVPQNLVDYSLECLNEDISLDELQRCIGKLQNNKSVSEDLI